MKLTTPAIFALAAVAITLIVGMVLIVIQAGPDAAAPLIALANLAGTIGLGAYTLSLRGELQQVKHNTNGANERLLTMVERQIPPITDPASERAQGI